MNYQTRRMLVMHLGLLTLAMVTTVCAIIVLDIGRGGSALLGGSLGMLSQLLAKEFLS